MYQDLNNELSQQLKTIKYLIIYQLLINIFNCYHNPLFIIFVILCNLSYYGVCHLKLGYIQCYLFYLICNFLFYTFNIIWVINYIHEFYPIFIFLLFQNIIYLWSIIKVSSLLYNINDGYTNV